MSAHAEPAARVKLPTRTLTDETGSGGSGRALRPTLPTRLAATRVREAGRKPASRVRSSLRSNGKVSGPEAASSPEGRARLTGYAEGGK